MAANPPSAVRAATANTGADCCLVVSSAAKAAAAPPDRLHFTHDVPALLRRASRILYPRYTLSRVIEIDTVGQSWEGEVEMEFLQIVDTRPGAMLFLNDTGGRLWNAPRDLLTGAWDGADFHKLAEKITESVVVNSNGAAVQPDDVIKRVAAVKELFPLELKNVQEVRKSEQWVKSLNLADLKSRGVQPWAMLVQRRKTVCSDDEKANPTKLDDLECETVGELLKRELKLAYLQPGSERWRTAFHDLEEAKPSVDLNENHHKLWNKVSTDASFADGEGKAIKDRFFESFCALSFKWKLTAKFGQALDLEVFPADHQHLYVRRCFLHRPGSKCRPRAQTWITTDTKRPTHPTTQQIDVGCNRECVPKLSNWRALDAGLSPPHTSSVAVEQLGIVFMRARPSLGKGSNTCEKPFERVWDDRHGANKSMVDWAASAARLEWSDPVVQPIDTHSSDPSLSRSNTRYAHAFFSFTTKRQSSHAVLNVVIPFALVTSSVGVAASVASADTRLQVTSSFFAVGMGLRFVSASLCV